MASVMCSRWNLNRGCIIKGMIGPWLYLLLSVLSITLHDKIYFTLGAKWSKDLQWFRCKATCGDGESTVADVITAINHTLSSL